MEQPNLQKQTANIQKSPSAISVIFRELMRDKLAMTSLIILFLLTVPVIIYSLILDQSEVVRVDLFNLFNEPSAEYWLGTDHGGRDVFGQLMIGARNSIFIGVAITVVSTIIGVGIGLISGFYGGNVDNFIMRIVDMFFILPTTLIIIAVVAIRPGYTMVEFCLIFIVFSWMGTCRLVRSKALQEASLEYVHAAKTLGTPNIKIIFSHVLPNVISIIIVNFTLSLAANIGIESGLSFLGFGFPETTPSLGTLVSYSTNPQIFELRPWIWLPAAVLIFVLMLCINNVGQALKRAADAKQRRG
ncbi:ABC transporter permease [Shouchella sp. JSM 1781072]|uniref:ABC transporter permease n=1 Tax=Bacillaceae TaxID=186817 RepID=UPI0021002648|nr:ABC transporter permease [Bacillus sp. Marseille-P3800]